MALLMHHTFVAVAVAVAVAIVDDVAIAIAIAIAIATYNILPSLSSLCCQECSTCRFAGLKCTIPSSVLLVIF